MVFLILTERSGKKCYPNFVIKILKLFEMVHETIYRFNIEYQCTALFISVTKCTAVYSNLDNSEGLYITLLVTFGHWYKMCLEFLNHFMNHFKNCFWWKLLNSLIPLLLMLEMFVKLIKVRFLFCGTNHSVVVKR